MKKLLSFLILLVFLFPLLEKGLHALQEEHEEHCAAHEVTHLHEKHHDCRYFDFSTDISFEVYKIFIPAHQTFFENGNSRLPDRVLLPVPYLFSLRAPPALS